MDTRKNHLGAGGAYIDANAVQHDVIGNPQRVFLDRAVEELVVVIVIGIGAVFVEEHVAVFVIGEGVALGRSLGGVFVGIGFVVFFVCTHGLSVRVFPLSPSLRKRRIVRTLGVQCRFRVWLARSGSARSAAFVRANRVLRYGHSQKMRWEVRANGNRIQRTPVWANLV